MNMDNKPVKDDIVVIIKESIKFSLVAITMFLIVGTSLLYLFIRFTDVYAEIAAMLTGVVVAILIVIADMKKIHTTDKITECSRKIIEKVLHI